MNSLRHSPMSNQKRIKCFESAPTQPYVAFKKRSVRVRLCSLDGTCVCRKSCFGQWLTAVL